MSADGSSVAIDRCLLRLVAAYLEKDGRKGFAADLREMADRSKETAPASEPAGDDAADAARFRWLLKKIGIRTRVSVPEFGQKLELVTVQFSRWLVPSDTKEGLRSLIDNSVPPDRGHTS